MTACFLGNPCPRIPAPETALAHATRTKVDFPAGRGPQEAPEEPIEGPTVAERQHRAHEEAGPQQEQAGEGRRRVIGAVHAHACNACNDFMDMAPDDATPIRRCTWPMCGREKATCCGVETFVALANHVQTVSLKEGNVAIYLLCRIVKT